MLLVSFARRKKTREKVEGARDGSSVEKAVLLYAEG